MDKSRFWEIKIFNDILWDHLYNVDPDMDETVNINLDFTTNSEKVVLDLASTYAKVFTNTDEKYEFLKKIPQKVLDAFLGYDAARYNINSNNLEPFTPKPIFVIATPYIFTNLEICFILNSLESKKYIHELWKKMHF